MERIINPCMICKNEIENRCEFRLDCHSKKTFDLPKWKLDIKKVLALPECINHILKSCP